MNIIPWSRHRVMPPTKELGDLWSRFFDGDPFGEHLPEVFRTTAFPKVNVAETEKGVEDTAELPGMDEKDIDVQVMGHTLVIAGEREWKQEKESKEYRRVESEYGHFRREVPLPDGLRLNADDITATYKKGILKIAVPKVEPTPASKIKVKAD